MHECISHFQPETLWLSHCRQGWRRCTQLLLTVMSTTVHPMIAQIQRHVKWMLVHAFISRCVVYCNTILDDADSGVVQRLQAVLHVEAPLTTGAPILCDNLPGCPCGNGTHKNRIGGLQLHPRHVSTVRVTSWMSVFSSHCCRCTNCTKLPSAARRYMNWLIDWLCR